MNQNLFKMLKFLQLVLFIILYDNMYFEVKVASEIGYRKNHSETKEHFSWKKSLGMLHCNFYLFFSFNLADLHKNIVYFCH